MDPHYAEIRSKVCVYEREYLQYTKCLSRDIELVVSGKPEELVRQALLYFLLHESGLSPDTIVVRTEHNNLDVAIYKPQTHEDFRPFPPPLVIVEVKREAVNLLDHEDQIFRYMKEYRTNTGVLFNGNKMIAYEKGQEGNPAKYSLEFLSELRDLLQRLAGQGEVDFCTFKRARDGDVDSFIYLADKYGKRALHKFTFTLKNSPTPIVGCFFRLQEQQVYYDVYAQYARKQRCFSQCEFDRLLSVIY